MKFKLSGVAAALFCCLSCVNVNPELGGVIALVILLFCFAMLHWARRHMKDHLRTDAISISSPVDEQ